MSDQFLVEYRVPPSLEGIYDGLDPALNDALYAPTRAQDLQNVRISGGKWTCRDGLSIWLNTSGSGAIRLFDVLYTSSGGRFRLMARGDDNAAILYDLEDGVDANFVATSGGTGLGTTTSVQPYFNGTPYDSNYYFTDRNGALKKYVTTGTVTTVAQPTAPAVAARTKPWTYGILERWTGAAPYGWTESDAANFSLSTVTGTIPPPMGDITVNLAITASADNDTITDDVSGEAIASHTIAFWWRSSASLQKHIQFGIGLAAADEYVTPFKVPIKQNWYPVFVQVGNLPSINKKRFKCIRALATQNFQITRLFLPGRLQGEYRWRYTHYDPTTGEESEPSPVTNDGAALDFSHIGVSFSDDPSASKAFQKSCMLDFTSDSGSDASTTKIRVYRSGGIPELTKDANGRDLWFRVGEVGDVNTTLNGAILAGVTSFVVNSASNIEASMWLVLDKGTADEEYVQVTSGYAGGTTINIQNATVFAHSNADAVQTAFLDNTGNESVNVLNVIHAERDDPPSGIHWIARAPDGRLWAFRYASNPSGIRVSNKPTPERPLDHEVFPDGVDPLTRQDPLQGWGFGLGTEAAGEEIMWGGFFRGLPYAITRNKVYQINALSQTDWSPNAVQKVLDIGCINGEAVQQQDGWLYWVSEGPRIVRWDGGGTVEVLSHQRVNERLKNAFNNINRWFARVHENKYGKYYSLFYAYGSSNLGLTSRLDFHITQNAWEESYWRDSNGLLHGWQAGKVFDGGSDNNSFYQINGRGYAFETEVDGTDDDNGVAIEYLWKTKRFDLGGVAELHSCYLRYVTSASDTVTLTVTAGGSDYGITTKTYTVTLNSTTDAEVRQYLERDLKGRWVEFQLSGNVDDGPQVRELVFWYRPMRERKSTSD